MGKTGKELIEEAENELTELLQEKIARLKLKRPTIRTKYGRVPRGMIDKDTGHEVEEI